MQQFDTLDTIHLRMHQLRRLKELKLPEGIFNQEALMLILNKQYKNHDGKRLLLKYVDLQDDPEIMERKCKVLSFLNDSKYKDLDELVIPEYQVHVDGKLAGFAMPLVENHKNLGAILRSRRIPFAKKKELLLKLGTLIDRVQRVESKNKMYFADLNEFNFILDSENELKAIDLDGAYISDREDITPYHLTYYLLNNKSLNSLPSKYIKNEKGDFIPNKDTDLYSYNMILLDIIADHPMFREDINTYFRYLDFLKKKGVDSQLIESFESIYSLKNNINPRLLIPEIDDHITHVSTFRQFQKNKSK